MLGSLFYKEKGMKSTRVDLKNLLVSKPTVIHVDEQFVNLEGVIFQPNIVEKIIIENYSGLRQISIYSSNKKVAVLPVVNKSECIIREVIDEDEEVIVIEVR